MKSFKFTKQTGQVALVFFTLYFTYGLFYIPFTQFLVSLAVGAIVYGIMDSYELATISLLATNFVFSMLVRTSRNEGFVGEEGTESGTQKDPKEKESTGLPNLGLPGGSLQGVGSQMSEGFADASDTDMSISEAKTSTESEVSVAKSKPASADSTDAVDGKDLEKMASMMKKMMAMNPDVLSSSKATKISEDNVPANEPQEVVKAKAKGKESFQDNSGLFKLGQIPKDEKGGHHIDAGTTVMNAISALKPDQIKAMTMDTKQLIETQKSLMGMLQTFQPMVSEGKQMMETFQEMFSPAMGSLDAAGKAVGK
jgi:hypothetical protein